MRYTFLMLALAAGCMRDVPDTMAHAETIIAAYEADYGDVSDSDADCVRDVAVRYAWHDTIERCDGAGGCTVSGPLNTRVWIAEGMSPENEACVIRHEYIHVLLWCMTGDSHPAHDVPELGYSGVCNAAGSLAN